jgi:WD40 repeat protein
VWDLETGQDLRTLIGHTDSVRGVAITPDGRHAVSASSDNTLKVWDLVTGQELQTLIGHASHVNGVAVTPDGRRAMSASNDNTLEVWDLENGQELRTLTGHSSGVFGVAVTPDGRRAVSASNDDTLKVWDLETGANIATFTCDSGAQCCVFADYRTIVAGDDAGRVYFLSLEFPNSSEIRSAVRGPRSHSLRAAPRCFRVSLSSRRAA